MRPHRNAHPIGPSNIIVGFSFFGIMAYRSAFRRLLMTYDGLLCTKTRRSFARTDTYPALAKSFSTLDTSRA